MRRLAIVNRGEPAMRVIHAVRELNAVPGRDPITLIALHTDEEADALFVRKADEAHAIDDYVDYAALEQALGATGADAVWVGWGFVSEHPAFVELCERLGITFVGPPSEVMAKVGDKIASKWLAEEAGVPVAAWSEGPVHDEREAAEHAERIGFPLMIKATAGGGGRGIRRVESAEGLAAAFRSARAEALDATGDGTLLMEAVIAPARHIEVQVIADGHGTVWAAGLRDCSCQRRNQKVLEESGSTALTPEQEQEILDAALRLARAAGYRSAGTVEFLYEPATGRAFFMEVNARLQVEHPVTEITTGLDLVKLQLHVAAGGRLEGDPPARAGHAVEARLNAEDPAAGFAPTPGRIAMLRLPTGPGLRVDSGVAEADTIPARFDSMIAKVIAHGSTREEAIARLRHALSETTVVIEGGTTNQGFLLDLLDSDEFRTGQFDTRWLDRLQVSNGIEQARHADLALLQAAVTLAEAETAIDRGRFLAFARRGRPQASRGVVRTVEVRHRGQTYKAAVAQVAPRRFEVTVDGTTVEVQVTRRNAHEGHLTVGGRRHRTLTTVQDTDVLVDVDGVPHRFSRDSGGIVRSSAPALVAAIPVEAGQEVAAGDVVAVVESMKMEISLSAPVAGRVRAVLATPNTQVGAHEALVQIDPAGAAQEAQSAAARIVLEAPESAKDCVDALQRLQWLTLGYDVTPVQAKQALHLLSTDCADRLGCDPRLAPEEQRLLALFADLRALMRRQTAPDSPGGAEHFFAFLRSLDAEAEGLPAEFTDVLRRVLAAYGVQGLERTPALEEACYRIFRANDRAAHARDAVLAILERTLVRARDLEGADDALRRTLDRLAELHDGQDAVLGDVAREVRYRCFEEPVIERARAEAYADAEQRLAHLTAADVEPLVALPQPLASMLTARLAGAAPDQRDLLLETMTRRYYRVRSLRDLRPQEIAGLPVLTWRYEHRGELRRLAVAFVEPEQIPAAAEAFAGWAAGLPEGEHAVADLYSLNARSDQASEALTARLARIPMPPNVHRVVVAVADPARGRGMDAVDILTFRPGADGRLAEQRELRGLHPIMAHRVSLWRLSNFELERLPSAVDVYLFRGTARENPADERLFAMAEVRDIGEMERMFVEALAGIRTFQARRKTSRRLHWNRVTLHAWPVIELTPEELRSTVARLAPLTAGMGIEMVMLYGRMRREDGQVRESVVRFFTPDGRDVVVEVDDPPRRPLGPLDEGAMRLVQARRRGMVHPAEIVKLLAPAHRDAAGQPAGDFRELDLDESGRLVEVDRPPATNRAGIVVGLVRNFTARHPEGMERVLLAGDPTRALGSLAEPECRRINAALDLAEEMGVPVDWFALSAGARIAMDSGTENMDWIADVLRRIILFTQAGGEINIVVAGVNVGAQPYWNAEATMLMHTRGILVMTPQSTMVLTGKQALDFSGAVSAEDNFGIGGYDRIMGPNGQAQYWAPDLAGACRLLLRYYEHAYVAPGERFPRRAQTRDPFDRDVRPAVHQAPGSVLLTVGEIFSARSNPDRKLPFDIRSVMRSVSDADFRPLERWTAMRGGEASVVWDAHLGGQPVMMIGIESRPLPRWGAVPADGPERWTAGTLFPRSAKKIARALNAASGRRPVVVIANLAGFDGSPESMRECQLEFGAEIGRAVVNFRGPIVFCVVSRYHGGAFVVFSQKLNDNLEAIALEGSKASVIGGGPAAGVVFAREVSTAAARDPEIVELDERIAAADGAELARLRSERDAAFARVRASRQGEFADCFDEVHSVERAVETGSVRRIIPAASLRPSLIDAVQRGIARTLAHEEEDGASARSATLAHPHAR